MQIEKILKIEELDERECIDIEVDGNHLFFANNILVHNSSSDLGMDDTSESFGLPATADFFIAAINTEELQARNQLLIKQLKNRYDDLNRKPRFVVGIDRAKMRIFETEEFAQDDLMQEDKPVMDSTKFGNRMFDEE